MVIDTTVLLGVVSSTWIEFDFAFQVDESNGDLKAAAA